VTSLRNSIQYKITNQLREELGIEEYETEDLLYQIFKNFRLSPNNVTGLRLSPYGLKIMKKVYDYYQYKIQDIKITSNIVIKMDKVMKFPYYVDGKQMVLFSGKDAFMLKLRGNDFNKWLKSLK
jgi:hypothetical protein